MADYLGFWSYVHRDDDRDHGRVIAIAHDLVDEYEGLTAERIELSLDRDDLHWGDAWLSRVDESLSNVAFFVPVLTPLFFRSSQCRRELQYFIEKTDSLGVSRLILPILYIPVPQLEVEQEEDPLIQAVRRIQWEDWSDLRLLERTSAEYRIGINRLAIELVRRVREVESVGVSASLPRQTGDADNPTGSDDDPGSLERLAALEESLPRWATTLHSVSGEIEQVGAIFKRGNEELAKRSRQGGGEFASRLIIARQLAADLTPVVERLEALGQNYAADLGHIDVGIRLILSSAAEEAAQDSEHLRQVCGFINSIKLLRSASSQGLGGLSGMVEASGSVEKLSKELRQPIRRMRSALTAMQVAQDILSSWAHLAESLNLDCPALDEIPGPAGRP